MRQSGSSQADMAVQAKNLYHDNEGKHFTFDHCWAILQYVVKWQDVPTAGGKKKSSKSAMATSSSPLSPGDFSLPGTYVSLDSDGTPTPTPTSAPSAGSVESPKGKRPIGRKAEKLSRTKSKVSEDHSASMRNLMEQFNNRHIERDIAKDAKAARKAELEERKLALMEKTLELENKDSEAKQRAADARDREIALKERERQDMIMSMDTSNMDPQTKLYWEIQKSDVIAKLSAQATATSASSDAYRLFFPFREM